MGILAARWKSSPAEAPVEYRMASFVFGFVLLAALGLFALFPQLKPDWIRTDVGDAQGPASTKGFHTRSASFTPQSTPADNCFNRGVNHAERGEWDQAIKEFTEAVRLEPNYAEAFHLRGIAWHSKQQLNEAISDYDAAVRLDPQNPDALLSRAKALFDQGLDDLVLADVEAAIRLSTDDPAAYWLRGKVREEAYDYRSALADYQQAVRLDAEDSISLNCLAWLLAAAPDAQLRDGRRAVQAALRACEIEKAEEWDAVDTLAAAFAEAGNFSKAVFSQKEALRLAPSEEHPDLQARLDLYKAKKPYRLPDKP